MNARTDTGRHPSRARPAPTTGLLESIPNAMPTRERHALLGLAVLVLGAILLDRSADLCSGVLHLVPALMLLAPLLLGRYLGERTLARLRGSRRPTLRPRRIPRWLAPPCLPASRIGLLAELFGRPPPLRA